MDIGYQQAVFVNENDGSILLEVELICQRKLHDSNAREIKVLLLISKTSITRRGYIHLTWHESNSKKQKNNGKPFQFPLL